MADTKRAGAAPADPQCPVETSLSVIGGKWKGIILFRLLDGARRFSQLQRLVPHITQRTLTLQLRELERDGIVSRRVFAEVPPHVEYALTPFGRTIRPVIDALQRWGLAYWKMKEDPQISVQS